MTSSLDPDLREEAKADIGRALTAISKRSAEMVSRDGELDEDLVNSQQSAVYDLAFLTAEQQALDIAVTAAERGDLPEGLAARATAALLSSALGRMLRLSAALGFPVDPPSRAILNAITQGFGKEATHSAINESGELGDLGLSGELRIAAQTFRRFGAEKIAPIAEELHRNDADIPDGVLEGLAVLGAFGLSIPEQYGGTYDPDGNGHVPMLIASEELSRFSLGSGGSVITRQEILGRALSHSGTEAQKVRWLPDLASGARLASIAVTEPDAGSDVAAVTTWAESTGDGYRISGAKMWSTFAGRSDLLLLLARTDHRGSRTHRGLSLFVIEKPRFLGSTFEVAQPGGGRMSGRAIPTIGYRGMHSFEVVFDGWAVPGDCLIGGADGSGQGFYQQMDAFVPGRLQTAARAVGVMRASLEAAMEHAQTRHVFGRPLAEFGLTADRLASSAATVAVLKLFTLSVASKLETTAGQFEAAMAKMLSCRAAERISRDAMQLFGGYGYAEEYPISRHFVDARVLSVFEGSEEVLALRVIGRQVLRSALGGG